MNVAQCALTCAVGADEISLDSIPFGVRNQADSDTAVVEDVA